MTMDKLEPTELEIGDMVFLGNSSAATKWRVVRKDALGNVRLENPHGAVRNIPNVDVLVGKLRRANGLPIKGRPLPPLMTDEERLRHRRAARPAAGKWTGRGIR